MEEEPNASIPASPFVERVRASFSLDPNLVSAEREKMNGNILTRSKPFQKLVDRAFKICDADQSGYLTKSELYTGFLLIHISLGKYAGPAACYPPSRAVVDKVFEAGDHNHSDGIDRQEFGIIMKVCCAQLTGRILSYWAILILLVPYLASHVINYFVIESGTYTEMAAEQAMSFLFFFLIIPLIWNRMDEAMQNNVTAAKKPTKTFRRLSNLAYMQAHRWQIMKKEIDLDDVKDCSVINACSESVLLGSHYGSIPVCPKDALLDV